MKVGLFNPYLDTMGGGERYFLTAAEFFLIRGDEVDIFWTESSTLSKVNDRFGINLNGVNLIPNFKTFGYDLIFFVSDGSLPLSFAKKTIIHFQVPFINIKNNILNKVKLFNSIVVCNSIFTKSFIDKTFSLNSSVIYPPVDIDNFKPGKKENIILAVGRFFAPLHPKKQEVMVEAFKNLNKKDWQLVLIGGVTGENSQKMVEDLREKSGGYDIKIITDSSFKVLKEYYSRAKIFWHAAGYGEDLVNHPERGEHFGMSTVEAMAAGCAPVVFSGGGQREIVEEKRNGFLWNNLDELIADTRSLMENEELRREIANQAVKSSQKFSKETFFKELKKIV